MAKTARAMMVAFSMSFRSSGSQRRPAPIRIIKAGASSTMCMRSCQKPQTSRRATIDRSEEHTSELQSLMRISYAVFCLKKKNKTQYKQPDNNITQYNQMKTDTCKIPTNIKLHDYD